MQKKKLYIFSKAFNLSANFFENNSLHKKAFIITYNNGTKNENSFETFSILMNLIYFVQIFEYLACPKCDVEIGD